MSKVTILITRKNIYSIAEGISATISQHNGGTPTFEQLLASADEAAKLDIYYREAISDLERHLTEWLKKSSSQFNLTKEGANYSLVLNMHQYWPANMEGLLANKVQDYMVHAVTAGWLNDFQGLEIKQDYLAMASQDISDIRGIIYLRAFDFAETARYDDGSSKEEPQSLTPSSRQEDSDKELPMLRHEAGYRGKDNAIKRDNDRRTFCLPKNIRHRDNDIVKQGSDWTDWSGTGIAYRDRMHAPGRRGAMTPPPAPPHSLIQAGCGINQESHRVVCGHGFTPSPFDQRPVGCEHAATLLPPHPDKDPRVPDNPSHPNYPPIHTDGKDWTDLYLYDAGGSEHGINGKCHK